MTTPSRSKAAIETVSAFARSSWRLGPGGDALVDPVLKQLTCAGARLGGEQKLAKAVDLPVRSSEDPGLRLHRGSSMADLTRSSVVDGLDRLLDNDYRLRLDPWNQLWRESTRPVSQPDDSARI